MPTRDQLDAWKRQAENGAGENWHERFIEAMEALEAVEKRPWIREPKRVIVLSRPNVHTSTLKIGKQVVPIRFCVPCTMYTTIALCPACLSPTLKAGRPPDEERPSPRPSVSELKPEPGSVTIEGYIDTEAYETKK